ncbi:hypothetical protein BCV70DRAFT_199607 [Testicularia cyperi]|uniref:Uncharacterized protein n=1 Tax=Testicularia cyperi TaxID=1882483 RepID=A0A317XV58_9BASI|nr:hypothetical protein BCV70DRAFT_199607 [Testicularia cyperi]
MSTSARASSSSSSSSSATDAGLSASVVDASTLHPSLSLVLPSWTSMTRSSRKSECKPHVLVHLPSSLFYDPFARTTVVASSASSPPSSSSTARTRYIATPLTQHTELEKPVGWSSHPSFRASLKGSRRQWWERHESTSSLDSLPEHLAKRLPKDVHVDQNAVNNFEAELQNALQDALRVAALEHNAANTGYSSHSSTASPPPPKESFHEYSSILLEVLPPSSSEVASQPIRLKLPLHARYLRPTPAASASPSSLWTGTRLLLDQILPGSLSNAGLALQRLLASRTDNTDAPSGVGVSQSQSRIKQNDLQSTGSRALVQLDTPSLFVSCSSTTNANANEGDHLPLLNGFHYTDLKSLFPPSHAHSLPLLPAHLDSQSSVLVPSYSANTIPALTLSLPTSSQALLPAVQFYTLSTVVLALCFVLLNLRANVRALDKIERH